MDRRRSRRRRGRSQGRTIVAILLIAAVLAVAGFARDSIGSGAFGESGTEAVATAEPEPRLELNAANSPITVTVTESDGRTPEPRIPLEQQGHSQNQPLPLDAPVDPACPQGCILRVAPGQVSSPLWQGDGVAYAFVTPGQLPKLNAATVVWSSSETLSLYVMYRVRPEHESLIKELGTVRDAAGSVRLVQAKRLPLPVSSLYAAGVWVEKLPPAGVIAGPAEPRTIEQTISALSAIGARDGATLGDRQFDGSGTVKAAEYLYRRFAELGFSVRYADFTDPQGGHQVNVVADPPSGRAANALMVTGHYDSISPPGQPAPGADDNASGIAGMLEIARRVAGQGFQPPLSFVGFGAEEPGLYGSNAYAAQLARDGVKLHGVINLDAMGIPNSGRVYVNGDTASRWIYRELVELSGDDYWLEWMSNSNFYSDDEHFRRQGYQAVMVTTHPWGTEPLHHTPRDTVENVDMRLVDDLTNLVWEWVLLQTRK